MSPLSSFPPNFHPSPLTKGGPRGVPNGGLASPRIAYIIRGRVRRTMRRRPSPVEAITPALAEERKADETPTVKPRALTRPRRPGPASPAAPPRFTPGATEMRLPAHSSLATAALLALALQPWLPSASFAQSGNPGFGGETVVGPPASPRIDFRSPATPQAARTWARLDKVVPVRFEKETSLEIVLQTIRKATAEAGDTGIPIYVDPLSLQEVEHGPQSPVTLHMETVPLKTALNLALKPLGLAYEVQDDGLLVISGPKSENSPLEPTPFILDELRALRAELAELRKDLATARGKSAAQSKGSAGTMRTGGGSR
jgi:hypothetical protein